MERPVKCASVASELSLDLWSASVDGNGRLFLLDGLFDLFDSLELSPKTRCRRLAIRALLVLLLALVPRVSQQRWVAR